MHEILGNIPHRYDIRTRFGPGYLLNIARAGRVTATTPGGRLIGLMEPGPEPGHRLEHGLRFGVGEGKVGGLGGLPARRLRR